MPIHILMAHTAAPDNRFGSQMTCQPPANRMLLGAGLQGEFSAYKKKEGVSPVHAGGSKCVNTDTHGCGDLVWQEYMSFLAGYCEGGYSCWLWFQCKHSVGSVRGRVCESESWALIDLLTQKRSCHRVHKGNMRRELGSNLTHWKWKSVWIFGGHTTIGF